MAKKKKVSKLYEGPLTDLIPDEVLYDAFKLNIWVSSFIGMMGFLATTEAARDKTKEANGGFLNGMMKIVSPAYAAADYLFGSEDKGEGVGILVDWGKMKNKYPAGSPAYAVMDIMSDDFTRWAILSSGFASAMVWSMFETKLIENLPEGIGEMIPG